MAYGDLPRHTDESVQTERPVVPVFDTTTGQEYGARIWCDPTRPGMGQLVYRRFWRGELEGRAQWVPLAAIADALNTTTPLVFP